jgi:hypothetical protein
MTFLFKFGKFKLLHTHMLNALNVIIFTINKSKLKCQYN